jgi:hypothetical protein
MAGLDAIQSFFTLLLSFGLPISSSYEHILFLFTLGLVFATIVSLILERRFHENIYVAIFVPSALAIFASGFAVAVFLSPSSHTAGDIVATFVFFLFIWCLVFHIVAWHFGKKLSLLHWPLFNDGNWVKATDYVYLALSAVGILNAVLGFTQITGYWAYMKVAAPLLLGIGVAIRISRTSVEIMKWY